MVKNLFLLGVKKADNFLKLPALWIFFYIWTYFFPMVSLPDCKCGYHLFDLDAPNTSAKPIYMQCHRFKCPVNRVERGTAQHRGSTLRIVSRKPTLDELRGQWKWRTTREIIAMLARNIGRKSKSGSSSINKIQLLNIKKAFLGINFYIQYMNVLWMNSGIVGHYLIELKTVIQFLILSLKPIMKFFQFHFVLKK